jgi:NAD(P)-dependent dehydrogenase (short-subunit alcohol dehydrogenase family)
MHAQGKIAVVTGGGAGIGRAVCLGLLNAGYNVVLAGRRLDPLNETISMAGENGAMAKAVPTDISDPDAVEELFKNIADTYGRLNLLFNNAGISAPNLLFEDLTFDQWKSVVDINLNGSFLCAHAAFNMMKNQNPQGGRIINNGSISAHAPRPDSAPYTTTKHAITGLTKSLSLDGRKYNIACGQIDIGNAGTEMAQRMADGIKQADGAVRTEPLMDVNHIADAIVHMDSFSLDTNVQFMTIMASKMPFVGRG